MCGLTHVTAAALCSSSSLLCISNSEWATENEGGWSVSVNGNEEPCWRDLSPIQFSFNCNYFLITHNKTAVHCVWGLSRVCAACLTPRLNQSSELRPSGNNIQICSLPGPRRIQGCDCILWWRVSYKLQSNCVVKCLICCLLHIQNDRQFAGILTESIQVDSVLSPNCDTPHAYTFSLAGSYCIQDIILSGKSHHPSLGTFFFVWRQAVQESPPLQLALCGRPSVLVQKCCGLYQVWIKCWKWLP